MKEKMINFLLENANPSIKRRIKSEILNNLKSEESAQYQEQILQEPNVQCVINSQKENGWIGKGLHGGLTEQEGGTKFLGEKAIDKNTPVLKRAMEAFANIPRTDVCYGTKGRYSDEFKMAANGSNLYRCTGIARAGYDDEIDISPQIQLSIDSFKRVLEVDSILDITYTNKSTKYRIFNEYEKWPCRYHMDILAHTNTWKSERNIKIIADSVNKMMRTDRPELFGIGTVSWIGHAVGTSGCFPSQGFKLKRAFIKTGAPYYHMEYIEWLVRCGVTLQIPLLIETVNEIKDAVSSEGVCKIPIEDAMFTSWGPYSGLQLEVDWKSKIRRDCDITFRALLILHYANFAV